MKSIEDVNFVFSHPRGPIYACISRRGLQALMLPGNRNARANVTASAANSPIGRKLQSALQRYFAGEPVDFLDIPLDVDGGTPFQLSVWRATREVSWGATTSYGDLGERSGHSHLAARAVGGALGRNPVPIIVPCHRVLPHTGGLGGFSAGLHWKRELLRLEGHEFP
jgi:methylated-DNA-[protein]-cysteine S-methyltransferase